MKFTLKKVAEQKYREAMVIVILDGNNVAILPWFRPIFKEGLIYKIEPQNNKYLSKKENEFIEFVLTTYLNQTIGMNGTEVIDYLVTVNLVVNDLDIHQLFHEEQN